MTHSPAYEKAYDTSPRTLVDCGCKAIVYQDGSGIELAFCSLHASASALREALKRCAWKLEAQDIRDGLMDMPSAELQAAQDALAEAEEEIKNRRSTSWNPNSSK